MRTKMFALISTFSIAALPVLAHADITVYNNTDSYATAYVKDSPCSSDLGNSGVAKPRQSLNIPHIVFTKYCGFSTCDAHIFATKDCGASGKEVATVTIDGFLGEVKSVNNLDSAHYDIQHGKNSVTVDAKSLFKNWFNFIF